MEEDAGKNVHGAAATRSSISTAPARRSIEIVGEPDLRSRAEAAEYLRALRDILMFLGVNDGNLEEGSFRCDANVSIRRRGEPKLGTRTELKNINSFRFVAEAIDVEIAPPDRARSSGASASRQETRGYNADKRETLPRCATRRTSPDYRYFPEPDLPPLVLDEAFVGARARASCRELPREKRARSSSELGLTPYAAGVLTQHPRIAAFFEEAATLARATPRASVGELRPEPRCCATCARAGPRRRRSRSRRRRSPSCCALVDDGHDQRQAGQGGLRGDRAAPSALAGATLVRERGMARAQRRGRDRGGRRARSSPRTRSRSRSYRAGKTALLGFFVGQVMKQTGGSASPAVVNNVLQARCSRRPAGERAEPTRPRDHRRRPPRAERLPILVRATAAVHAPASARRRPEPDGRASRRSRAPCTQRRRRRRPPLRAMPSAAAPIAARRCPDS